ncbi:2'-5' RNA ligase family protein [Novosphingobium huizhouense]|uniref:2'-5' RNA ligase family protein n=1 Tax=Novosphingobium huizhouense TaxID=2866625 RepID=UPI001CD8F5BA|nr:2'-5' RNA ligase family protein [Novosphingobium huizhouense]
MTARDLPARPPLVITATLPDDLQGWAEGLRRAHFPPERNYLAAHVTLFHALPAMVEDEARSVLSRLCAETPPPPARLEAIMNLGGGTAFAIASPAMLDLRAAIAERFHGLLTGQDGHAPRLHVTVQNKVTAAEARRLQAALAAQFRPRDFAFAGLELHRYFGGPWQKLGAWTFRGRR